MPGFLRLLSFHAVCVCLCIHPQGYELHSHDIESVEQVQQDCYIYILKHNKAILSMGMALVTKHAVKETNLIIIQVINSTVSHF